MLIKMPKFLLNVQMFWACALQWNVHRYQLRHDIKYCIKFEIIIMPNHQRVFHLFTS